jgi:hypothetical protein
MANRLQNHGIPHVRNGNPQPAPATNSTESSAARRDGNLVSWWKQFKRGGKVEKEEDKGTFSSSPYVDKARGRCILGPNEASSPVNKACYDAEDFGTSSILDLLLIVSIVAYRMPTLPYHCSTRQERATYMVMCP